MHSKRLKAYQTELQKLEKPQDLLRIKTLEYEITCIVLKQIPYRQITDDGYDTDLAITKLIVRTVNNGDPTLSNKEVNVDLSEVIEMEALIV